MAKVLVTDAGGHNAAALIRSLGRKDINVVASESYRFALGFFSKHCSKSLVYPDAVYYPEKWLDWLLQEISKGDYDTIMPNSDDCVGIVSKNKEEISKYTKVPVADYSTWIKARDKAESLKLAAKLNVPCPQTYFISGIDEVKEIADEIIYPVIIKPRMSVGSWGITYIEKKEELLDKYLLVHDKYPYPMIQEFIPQGGNGYGVFLLFNQNSEPRAIFAHKRLREFPINGGPSTLRESVHKPELVEMSIRLLKAMKWYGVAMVEFKEDPRDGQCKLMEINPRFWGSLALSVAAGIDFPYLLYKMVMEGDVEPVWNYPEGIRCRWLLPGDILHFLKNPNRFRLKPSFFKFSRNNRNDDFISWRDPGPTIGFFLNAFVSLFKANRWKLLFSRSGRFLPLSK